MCKTGWQPVLFFLCRCSVLLGTLPVCSPSRFLPRCHHPPPGPPHPDRWLPSPPPAPFSTTFGATSASATTSVVCWTTAGSCGHGKAGGTTAPTPPSTPPRAWTLPPCRRRSGRCGVGQNTWKNACFFFTADAPYSSGGFFLCLACACNKKRTRAVHRCKAKLGQLCR